MPNHVDTKRRAPLLVEWFVASGGFVTTFARSVREVSRFLLTPSQYVQLITDQILALGIQSLPLVIVAGAATGAVMAIQFGYGLQRFGGLNSVPMLVGLAVFRELGPVLTSLLLAGRIGSGIAAEIGSMSVTQQVDALRALGTSPYSTLVFPRVVAAFLAFPILGLCSDYVSIVSGMIVCLAEFGMEPAFYFSKTVEGLVTSDLLTGVAKMFIFGFMVSIAACWKGLETKGGTRSVGDSTTWVVVTSSVMILVTDVVLNQIFVAMGFFR
jgi:phospholipid/cholesterol/gamma-HCH transport system permease protein